MLQQNNASDLPDFIVKSALAVSLVSIPLILPFSINNFIQGRFLIGALSIGVVILAIIDALLCYRNRYYKSIHLFAAAPILIISIAVIIYEIGVAGSYWAYLGVLSFYFILPKTLAWKINVIFLIIIYPIAWQVLEFPIAIRFAAVLAGVSVYAYTAMSEISKQHLLLKEKSVTDSLTGLYNRSLLKSSLEYAVLQSERTKIPVALLMIDLDNFKLINDQLGHSMGDSVLKAMGDFLLESFRASDMVFRIGGEEFLVLVHDVDSPAALRIAEDLRMEIEKMPLVPNHPVTISIGVFSLRPGTSWEESMKVCDENLYLAKSNGRNQVIG